MYQPNFCAECGERIARARWRLWTSRRFCPQCASRFRNARILLLPLLAGAMLFSLGLGAGRASRPAQPPLVVERHQSPVALTQTAQALTTQANTKRESQPAPARPEPNAARAGSESTLDSSETVSICGALTKKGTPCRRRVRGTGRCWQHKGQPAMLPAEQLIVRE